MVLEVKMAKDVRGEYRAWVPALPGCAVRAESPAAARQDITEAIAGYLASLNGSRRFDIACTEPREGSSPLSLRERAG
jgi:predicted RNase H-like HicB family nuclease